MSKNVRILYNLCFTCLFLTLCNLSNCSLIHAFHSVDRWWVPSSELNSIQYVAFSISCSWDTVVIVLCVAPHVVNPQYVSSNSWALIVLGAESDTGEATPRLPTQIICGLLQIWNGVRFIAPPLIIPPSPQNTCIIAVAFLLTLSSATFASQWLSLCAYIWDHFQHFSSHCLSFKKMFHYIEMKLRRKNNTFIITASMKISQALCRKHQ